MLSIDQRISRRLNWYKSRFQINNPIVGRAVELWGNKVWMDGLCYSVDCPSITTEHKSTLAFGFHEVEERALVRRWLPKDIPVLEFGGGLGVVSCLANGKLRRPHQHIVLEANPAMMSILATNRDLNHCKFKVINMAIAYTGEFVELGRGRVFVGSSTKNSAADTIRVPATTIAALLAESNFETIGIICDIEGTESDIIQKELPMLGERVRFFMAEMHPSILGSDSVEHLLQRVGDLGFRLCEKNGDSVFFSRDLK